MSSDSRESNLNLKLLLLSHLKSYWLEILTNLQDLYVVKVLAQMDEEETNEIDNFLERLCDTKITDLYFISEKGFHCFLTRFTELKF